MGKTIFLEEEPAFEAKAGMVYITGLGEDLTIIMRRSTFNGVVRSAVQLLRDNAQRAEVIPFDRFSERQS